MQTSNAHLIAPLERMAPPPELDGSLGTYRIMGANSNYKTDIDAINSWLEGCSADTKRQYTNKIEQLLCWAWVDRRKPFSSLCANDFRLYNEFLQNVQPSNMWITSKGTKRNSVHWKPFASVALKLASRASIFSVLSSLAEWLKHERYCDLKIETVDRVDRGFNVASSKILVKAKALPPVASEVDIRYMMNALSEPLGKGLLCHLIFCLRYFANLDASQIEVAKFADIVRLGRGHLVLRTSSYGSEGEVLLLPPAIASLAKAHNQHPSLSHQDQIEAIAAIAKAFPNRELTGSSATGYHIKALIAKAASMASAAGDYQGARRLATLKPVSLRNSFQLQMRTIDERRSAWHVLGAPFPLSGGATQPSRPPIDAHVASRAEEMFRMRWLANGFTLLCWGSSAAQ